MTEKLPISINVCDDLAEQLLTIQSVMNKLAAQFNFQAMTANWYGDEDAIIYIQLSIETPQRFTNQKENQQTQQAKEFVIHSDDVFSFVDEKQPPQLNCIIAITELEQSLLNENAKILGSFLQMKLQKVLNIIANKLSLKPI
jgi:hypothetical protein